MAEGPTDAQITRWYNLVLADASIRQLGATAYDIVQALLVDLAASAPADRAELKETARIALLAEKQATLADRRGAPEWRALTENEAQTVADACERYAVPT